MRDFIVIPAYNEGLRIAPVLRKVKQYSANVVVVDDGSSDNTCQLAKSEGVTVIRHSVNLGKGATLKTGCDYVLETGAERIVVLDADGQHEPREIPKFFNALNSVDIVYSFRQESFRMPLVLRFGNNFINNVLRSLFKVNIHDSQCGYRAFTAEAYRKVRWEATDYFMETEMIIRASRNKLRYNQLPIQTIYSDRYKGTTILDGVKIFCKLVWGWLS